MTVSSAKLRSTTRFAAFIAALALALAAIVFRLTQVQIIDGEDFAAARAPIRSNSSRSLHRAG